MSARQKIFAVTVAISIFILILELVRRKKMKEEYSWLWLLTGGVIILLTMKYELLGWLTHTIGAVLPTTTLFLFAILFLILVGIFFSVKLSKLTLQVKNLAQELAITRAELDELKNNQGHSQP